VSFEAYLLAALQPISSSLGGGGQCSPTLIGNFNRECKAKIIATVMQMLIETKNGTWNITSMAGVSKMTNLASSRYHT
jgi:hypothetical protein